MKAETLVEGVRARVGLFGVQHDLQDVGALEVAHRLGDEPRADAAPFGAGVYGDAHEVASGGIHRVELVADDAGVVFGDDEVGIGGVDLQEVRRVVPPERGEAEGFDGQRPATSAGVNGRTRTSRLPGVGIVIVLFVIRAQQRGQVEVARSSAARSQSLATSPPE